MDFSAREHNGSIELVIELKNRGSGPAHLLRADASARYRASAVPLDLAALPLRLSARLPGRDVHPHAAEPGRGAVSPLAEIVARRDPPRRARFRSTASWRRRSTIHPRLLPARARSVRQAWRLLHRRADPAGVRHPDGRAHPGALPARWARRRISRSSNWAPADARWPKHSPNGATFRWTSPQAALPERFRGVVFCQ